MSNTIDLSLSVMRFYQGKDWTTNLAKKHEQDQGNNHLPTPAPTAVERALKLQEELTSLKEEAIGEILARKKDLDLQLSQLGYREQPRYAPPSKPSGAGKPLGSKPAEQKYCPICKVNGHDGRAHRSQGANKRPFTEEERNALGLAAPTLVGVE
jgi:hypothetical protein